MTSLPNGAGRVMTVAGPTDPEALGHTVTSVHLVNAVHLVNDLNGAPAPLTMDRLGALALDSPDEADLRLSAEDVRADLADFAERGGGAVVEVTGTDLGRRAPELARLSRETGVAVVMGSASGTAEELVRDLTEGVDGVRAGLIGKIGPLDLDQAADRAVALAVADAARRTGAPVLVERAATAAATHTLIDLLTEGGADPGRIAVGHCDGLAADVDALAELAGRGVFVQFDELGRLPTVYREVDDQDVAAAVLALAGRGHAERILLSPRVSQKIGLKGYGGVGYGFVAQQFVPFLQFQGTDDALLRTLTAANPSRWLTFTEARG
ncbi:phosphotriesterase [Actinomadura meridiana]|uniref:Phosphotriesterase n=1 Tax=Actinomadura meridiana TaxID=559626 RepID=A0ABP8CJH3_9ACTN